MDPLPARRTTPGFQRWACILLVMLTSLPASALESETCFSRQHRGATVALQAALNQTAVAAMDARLVHSERDCVLACCSEEVRPGARCNMVLFNGKKAAGEENCFLFHCDGEQDCPLMKAQDGINTYNIYKGLIHPPTPRPITMTTAATNRFPLTTTLLLTATPTTTTTTVTPTSTTQAPVTTTAPPPVIIATTPTVTAPPGTTTKTTTTAASLSAPTLTPKRPNKTSRKQNKSTKKGKSHGVSAQPQPSLTTSLPVPTEVTLAAQRTTDTARLQTETTTSESTPTGSTAIPATTAAATTTSTTNPPPTTTTIPTPTTTASLSTMESSTTRATPAAGLIIVPKEAVQANHVLQNSSPAHGKTAVVHGALKSGMVAFMVVAFAVVTLALAVGGRKAMESFDRRHYTRLELNDLHYEV